LHAFVDELTMFPGDLTELGDLGTVRVNVRRNEETETAELDGDE